MASELQVVVVGDDHDRALDRSIAHVAGLLDDLEARWSRFLPHSDITLLNNSPGSWIDVDPSTITLVASMIEAWRATDGAFDPSVLPILVDAGYGASIDDPWKVTILPDGQLVALGTDGGPTMGEIEIDPSGGAIRLPAGLTLDPGGIGKGLAADIAVQRLLDLGVSGALVSIGGDMTMAGTAPSSEAGGWSISVEDPDPSNGELCRLVVSGGGVATSSTRSRRWVRAGRERHHVVDPRLAAQSSTDLATVTVIARSGWLAEAHATAALLAGSGGAMDHLDRHGLTGLAVGLDGSLQSTADLAVTRELVDR
jgi:thiamine biosynthesis lipoprotein